MSGIAYPLTILFATHLLHLEVESATENSRQIHENKSELLNLG